MHKSKKLTRRILSGATAFSLAAATMLGQLAVTSAASENHVYSTAQSVTAGEEAHIPIFIENNTGFVSFNIYISYDPDVVTPVSVSTENSVLTGSGDVNDSIGGNLRGLPENTVQVTFTSSDYTNATADGALFDFVCDVSEGATGSTTLGLSYDPDPDITFNSDDEAVVFDCTDIELSIANAALDSLPSVALSAEPCKAGESLTLSSAYTKKPDSFGDIHIELGYDKWSFSEPEVTVGEGELSGLSDEDGKLAFDITGAEGKASAPFTVVFKVDSDACEGSYAFKGTGSIGASQLNVTGCKVGISSDVKSASPIVSGPDGLSAKKGETLTVPVSIGRNSGLMGFIVEFSFDDTALEIVGAESTKLLAGSMNNNIGVEKGGFIVRWSNTENTTAEGEFLNVTFNVIGDKAADTVIGISYSAEDTFDESYNDVALICKDITVSLN
ncbi:MAG: cohesin domain-containing protein, partial [Ruminococcus sp.]|nr:cohesin domain-containing protein [Ruminococcus sp.]